MFWNGAALVHARPHSVGHLEWEMGLDARVEERPDIGDDSLQVRQLTAREAAGLKVELSAPDPQPPP